MPLDDLAHVARPAASCAGGEPAGALVLMHGRGTNEQDLYGLLDVFDPEARLLGVVPRAPLQLPPGGFHWYVTRQVGFPDRESFTTTALLLSGWLDALSEDTGIPAGRIILGGFSQGCVMSWAMALNPDRPRPAGVLALSGFMPKVDDYALDQDIAGLPVAIAHGTQDPIIGVEFGREARDVATAAGADVLYRETPVPHTIDPRIVPELVTWVRARADSAE